MHKNIELFQLQKSYIKIKAFQKQPFYLATTAFMYTRRMLSTPSTAKIQELQSLSPDQAREIASKFGTPVYAYSAAILLDKAEQALGFEAPFGLTVRYAMKANPLRAILQLFHETGIHIDASSGHEAHRAIAAGIPPANILITSQQLPADLADLIKQGVLFNATSLHQLSQYGRQFPGSVVSVRINPGIGSGHSLKVSTGGPTSSFGIWHDDIPFIKEEAEKYQLTINKIHTHIGAGNDPLMWHEAARTTLGLAEHFDTVIAVNLGGGFKVARITEEHATDIQSVSKPVAELLRDFAARTGRKLHLEIEPGTFLVANAGSIISRIDDLTSTGPDGYDFIKLDTGMNEIIRPALYGAQHPIIVLNDQPSVAKPYVVVGHTCESSDLLTPEPTDAEIPSNRMLQQASVGDLVVIEGTGAYCSSMSTKGYNSYPQPPEVMIQQDSTITLAKKAGTLADQLAKEL
jgi:diaminopimelate decarboxylase